MSFLTPVNKYSYENLFITVYYCFPLSQFVFSKKVVYKSSVDDAHHFYADPDLTYHFDADPNPTFHPNPDPDPSFQIKAQILEKMLK